MRIKYHVPILELDVIVMVNRDMRREKGLPPREYITMEDNIAYWRLHRDKYPRPLTVEEKMAKRQKEEEEREMEKQRLRVEQGRKGIDLNAKYPSGSWED